MNILLYPCSVQGSFNSEGGKEWDLPVASASKVSEGRHDFHYQGSCVNSSPNVCFVGLLRQLHLFYGNFRLLQLTGWLLKAHGCCSFLSQQLTVV